MFCVESLEIWEGKKESSFYGGAFGIEPDFLLNRSSFSFG
jgi:hypothetical protein